MRKIVGFLFPWRRTFRRLELEKRWWHRLAIVLLFVALIPAFLCSWVIGNDAVPVNLFNQAIIYFDAVPLSHDVTAPEQQQNPDSRPAVGQKEIEMPDGKLATYPGNTSDDTIKAEWQHNLNVTQARAALLGFGIALLAMMLVSYLLQAMYRALLFVIFGAKAKNIPQGPTASA